MALLHRLPLLLLALHALLAGASSTSYKEAVIRKRHGHGRNHYSSHRYAHTPEFERDKLYEMSGMIEIPPPDEPERDLLPEVYPHEPPVKKESPRDNEEEEEEQLDKPNKPHESPKSPPVAKDEQGPALGAENEKGSNRCSLPACSSDLEMSKQIRIYQIQAQILKETGITSLPNMTGFVLPQNPYLQKIISDVNEQAHAFDFHRKKPPYHSILGDEPNIRSEQIFLSASKAPAWVKIPEGHKLHYFNLSREHSSSIVMANIHMWLKPLSDSRSQDKVAKIVILKVEPSKFPNDYNRLRSVNNDVNVEYSPQGIWAKVDASYMVRQWLMNEEDNLGFVVKVSTMDGRVVEVDTADDDPIHAPLLEMDLREERNDRPKRFANNRICSDRKIERLCCRYPLIIDFLKYKFDFIVAPKKYVANYCRGECPLLYAHKVPHSTVLQQMFPNTTTSIHGPCCGARELAPLKILYFDGEKLKIDTINDMVVKQCSCT